MSKAKKEKAVVSATPKTDPSFSIDRKELIRGLSTVKPTISSASCLPVLSFIHAKWGVDKITFTATDLVTFMSCTVPIKTATTGEIVFPGVLVLKVIEKFTDDTVKISVNDKQIVLLTCGEAKYKFAGMSPEEFPSVPEIKSKGVIEVESASFRRALESTAFAACTDDSRAILMGSFVSLSKKVVVCTNARMLAMCSDLPNVKTPDIVIPSITVSRLLPILGEEGNVKIEVGESKVRLSFVDTVVVSNLIEGTFPNYKQVIPTESKYKASIDVPAILDVLNRVALVTASNCPSVALSFSKDTLGISTNNVDVGDAQETIPIKYQGDKLTISFNPEMFLDVFGYLAEGEATVEFNDDLSPITIKSGSLLYVIMPLRMN